MTNPQGGIVAVSMTAQGFNSTANCTTVGGKNVMKKFRERRLMQMGKQQIKCPPIIVTKLNPPQAIVIENSPKKNSAGTEDPLGELEAELKVLEFRDFPKVQLKGNYKNKTKSNR
jgi:hypothetical protein